jgi:hypothetical protein
MAPLLIGLFIEKTMMEPFWLSASAGFFTFTTLHLSYPDLSHEVFLISSIVSLSTYLASYFVYRKRKTQASSFSFSKLCDEIVANYSTQPGIFGWVILFLFLASTFVRNLYYGHNAVVMSIEGLAMALGFILLCADMLPIKLRSAIVLGSTWYCIAFAPVYIFLHQKAGAFFAINLITSVILLVWQFNWNLFLTFLLTGTPTAVIAFSFFNHGLQESIAPLMYLSLSLGTIAMVTYIAFRKKEQAVAEAVRSQLKLDQEKRHAINTSMDADYKYKNDLLNKDETIEVAFKELQKDTDGYFKSPTFTMDVTLKVVNSPHEVISTNLPVGIFYKIVYSLLFNTIHCSNNGDIVRLKFCCDKNGRLESIEIKHGLFRIGDRAKHLKGSYPKEILSWDIIKALFAQFDIEIKDGLTTLRIIFPSGTTPSESKVVSIKSLRERATKEAVS